MHFVFCGDSPEFEQYKICYGNDIYGSLLQETIEVWPKAGLVWLLSYKSMWKSRQVYGQKLIWQQDYSIK